MNVTDKRDLDTLTQADCNRSVTGGVALLPQAQAHAELRPIQNVVAPGD